MGNKVSKYNDDKSFDKYDKMALMVDLIANRVILKEVKHHSALSEGSKCSQLIIITSEILKRLPFRVISFMGRKRNILGTDYENYGATDRLLLLDMNSSTLKESGIDETDSFKKTQMCIGIARFYTQIGNLFNAIITTIRPYDYLNDRSTAPLNFCDMLTNSLVQDDDFENYRSSNLSKFLEKQKNLSEKIASLQRKGEPTSMAPSACKVADTIKKTISRTSSSSSGFSSSSNTSLFSSLDKLYLNIFNEKSFVNSKPGFSGMSDRMIKDIYLPDVHHLYKLVTGNTAGSEIKSFGDIPFDSLQNADISKFCEKPGSNGKKTSELSTGFEVNDTMRMTQVFANYIEHIQTMIAKTNKQRGELLNLLDKVFVMQPKNDAEIRKIQEDFGKGTRGLDESETTTAYSRRFQRYSMLNNFYINPDLTDATLQGLINEARVRIVKMYASCQEDFVKGVQLLHDLHTNVNLRVLDATGTQARTRGEQLSASSGQGNGEESIIKTLGEISNDMISKYSSFKREIRDKIRDRDLSTKISAEVRLIDDEFDRVIQSRISSWKSKSGDRDSIAELKLIISRSQEKLKSALNPKEKLLA